MIIASLLLALQLSSPCPPSLSCPSRLWEDQLAARLTVAPVGVVAHPGQPAKWFLLAETAEVGVFEGWALATHHDTVSQMLQAESRIHPSVRWSIVAGMVMLTWHLAWGFPW